MGPMQIIEARRDSFLISTDPARLDVDAIHSALTTMYWSEGISRELVARALSNSLVFGLYEGEEQIGLARVITDAATFAYLCDVYVLEAYRGRGLAHWLMEVVMQHEALRGVRRFSLVTRDAHALYADFGFKPLADATRHMEISRPGMYLQ